MADVTKSFDDRDSFIHWFIIASICDLPITKAMQQIPRNITMQLNGEEVDPIRALTRLEDAYGEQIEIEAKKMLEKVKLDVMEPFENMIDEVVETMTDAVNKKFKVGLKHE